MRKIKPRNCLTLLSAVVVVMLMAGMAHAVTYDLTADEAPITMPDGTPVPMWGFGLTGGPVSVPGPVLEAVEGDDLTINLTNNLAEPVTIVIHGQRVPSPSPVMSGGRVMSFTPETASVTFSDLKAGTYLYESGTHPAKQAPMGLYGVLIVRPTTPGQAYNDPISAYAWEEVLLLSDIDPLLNAAVQSGAYGTPAYPSTVDYLPRYFLINGKAYPETLPMTAPAGGAVLLRMVNAGLRNYVPVLEGLYMTVIAEDGNLLPFPQEVLAVPLPAGKTKDVLVVFEEVGTYALFDRRLNLSNAGAVGVGGLLTHIVAEEATAPVIDSFTATPGTITAGESSTLAWATTGAATVTIDQGVGSQPVDGSTSVSPAVTTTYTLTATGPGGSAMDSVTVTVNPSTVTTTFVSVASHDGWVRESVLQANVGGTTNSTATGAGALRIGDEFLGVFAVEPQLKSIVSFNTSSIPDTAVIQSATLRLVRGGIAGTNPFNTHGTCYLDIITGSFSGSSALQSGDFQASATATRVASMSNPTSNGSQSIGALNAAGHAAINKTGITQLRVYFSVDDNDDGGSDAIGLYSAENSTAANRPVLEITYTP